MRRDLFRRLIGQVRAVYRSDAPLFAFADGVPAVAPGLYRALKDGSEMRFVSNGTHYRLGGGKVWPLTATLLPLPDRYGFCIFQQSDGMATSFYGALRPGADRHGFDLFSPESVPAAALDTAIGNGAAAIDAGYLFTDRASLATALASLALEAPPGAWEGYRLA